MVGCIINITFIACFTGQQETEHLSLQSSYGLFYKLFNGKASKLASNIYALTNLTSSIATFSVPSLSFKRIQHP